MTDTTETIVTPDPHAIARAVLLEVAGESDQVGDFVTSYDLEDHVTDFRFAANIRGYEGWQWSVTLYHDEEIDSWTVNESSLIPTEDALMPPKWIPWKDRLEPTDLAPTDSIGTDPDDERIEEGEVEESSLQDVNDAVETFRLTRRHVLTSLGRAQAAKRWYEGPRGPKALSTKTAEGNLCSTCGFFVPLAGELDRMFGVCANKWSPDDGRVVSLDVVANRPRKQEPAAQDEAEGETDKTGEPAGDDIEAQKTVDGNAVDTEPAEEAAGDGTSQSQSAGDESVAQNVSDSVVDVDAADSSDDSKSDADDEATEEDILNNTVADDDEDDEMDDEEDNVRPSDDVTPELETVIDLIEQLRQNRADEE